MDEKYKFETITEAGEEILAPEVSNLPRYVNRTLSDLEYANNPPPVVRKILWFKFRNKGVNRNPFVAYRATQMMLKTTYVIWAISFLFLFGAAINFFLLEKVELSATSHDARIESTGAPKRVRGIE
jgi:hypothetical protein